VREAREKFERRRTARFILLKECRTLKGLVCRCSRGRELCGLRKTRIPGSSVRVIGVYF